MKKLIQKCKNYFFKPIDVCGEKLPEAKIKTVTPEKTNQPLQNAMRHGDRKRYFTNYNAGLLNRISEIKSSK